MLIRVGAVLLAFSLSALRLQWSPACYCLRATQIGHNFASCRRVLTTEGQSGPHAANQSCFENVCLVSNVTVPLPARSVSVACVTRAVSRFPRKVGIRNVRSSCYGSHTGNELRSRQSEGGACSYGMPGRSGSRAVVCYSLHDSRDRPVADRARSITRFCCDRVRCRLGACM